MTNIYFIRHADSDLSVRDERIRPLTVKGREDAVKVLELFDGISIDHFYSSPFRRSIETIKPLADEKKCFIRLIENFRERENGSWVKNFLDHAGKQWNDFDYKLENGESLNEVQSRTIVELNIILEDHGNQNIVIGTHGAALSTIINFFDDSKGYEYFKSIIDVKPLIVKMQFNGTHLISIHEMRLYSVEGCFSI